MLLALPLSIFGCGPQIKPAKYQAEYYFVDHIESAEAIKKHRRALSAPYFAIGHDERRVLFQHPPSAYRFKEVPSGPGARFLVAPTMNPVAWEKKTDGIGFSVSCRAPEGGRNQLLEMTIDPANNPADRIWHDREIVLDGCSQPTTDFELRTNCGKLRNCGADWAAWGHPRVIYEETFEPGFEQLAILISVDTLRPDRLSLYGNERPTSPELERLAQDSIVFETAIAPAPWTIPSHASMLTSTYPRVHGANAHASISESIPMLGEVLAGAGWQTAGFVDSPYVSSSFGFNRGFAHFDDDKAPKGDIRRGARSVRQRLIDWLKGHTEKPAFLFWHLMDVHGPYWGPPPFGGKFRDTVEPPQEDPDPRLEHLRQFGYHHYLQLNRFSSLEDLIAAYDESIVSVDAALGDFLQLLRDTGLYDDALIVITADHGESFLDHGIWVGHGLFLTDDEVRVPLIVKLPGNRHAGTRVSEMVSLLDVAPTILDALDVERPASFQGVSLIDPAPGKPQSLPKVVFGHSSNTGGSSVRTDTFKYIAPARVAPGKVLRQSLKPRHGKSLPLRPLLSEQLYHLRQDSEEKSSLVEHDRSEQQLQEFRAQIDQHIADSKARREGVVEAEAPQLSEEAKRRLEALGYVD